MPEARGRRPEADPGSRSSDPSSQESQPGDPKLHAATLLDQADRLTQLARELQHEARRLNAALGVSGPPAESGSVRERRFAPASERQGRVATEVAPEPDDLPISDGARLMITNMVTLGSSREEISRADARRAGARERRRNPRSPHQVTAGSTRSLRPSHSGARTSCSPEMAKACRYTQGARSNGRGSANQLLGPLPSLARQGRVGARRRAAPEKALTPRHRPSTGRSSCSRSSWSARWPGSSPLPPGSAPSSQRPPMACDQKPKRHGDDDGGFERRGSIEHRWRPILRPARARRRADGAGSYAGRAVRPADRRPG